MAAPFTGFWKKKITDLESTVVSGSSETPASVKTKLLQNADTNVLTNAEKTKLVDLPTNSALTSTLLGKQDSLGFTAENAASKGAANGYVPLNGSSQIDSIYLPSYVDDVIEAANFAALPGTGVSGKIYITLDNNKQFRWSGSVYVDISGTGGETVTTLGALVNGATAKATPADTDMFPGMDSGASNIIKKFSWANIKAALKAYFDALYNVFNVTSFSTALAFDTDKQHTYAGSAALSFTLNAIGAVLGKTYKIIIPAGTASSIAFSGDFIVRNLTDFSTSQRCVIHCEYNGTNIDAYVENPAALIPWADVDHPTFATIATSGSGSDLTNNTVANTKLDADIKIGSIAGLNTALTKTWDEIADFITELYGLISGKQATLVSGTNIKTINSTSLLGSGNIDIGGSSITKDYTLEAYAALGSVVKGQTVGLNTTIASGAPALSDGALRLVPVWIATDGNITGIKLFQRAAGAYTGDNENVVALFSYSAGVLTKQAACANNANLWVNSSNTWVTIPFDVPYNVVTPGLYYIGLLYNQSAQTTAPTLAGGVSLGNGNQNLMDFTNTARLFAELAGQTTMPASVTMSAAANTTSIALVFVY